MARQLEDGQYVIEEGFFSVGGAWQAEVIVRRPDAFDARTAFRFIAADTSAGGSSLIPPDPDKGQFNFGLELFGGATLYMGVGVAAGVWRTRRGAPLLGPGLAGLDSQTNPFPPDQASIGTGRQLYTQNCQVCHIVSDLGDGPSSVGSNPPPTDLAVHVPLHADPDLFNIIRDGVLGSAMTSFNEALTEDEI